MRGPIYPTAMAHSMPMNLGFKSKTICKRKTPKRFENRISKQLKRKMTEEFSD